MEEVPFRAPVVPDQPLRELGQPHLLAVAHAGLAAHARPGLFLGLVPGHVLPIDQDVHSPLLVSTASPARPVDEQAHGKALGALATYAEAVAALPSQLSAVTPAQAQALHHAASAAQAACRQLRSVAAGLPPLAVGACAAIPAGARKARSDAALRLFLLRVQNDILNQSQYGRKDLVAAVGGVQGMTLNPDDAATTIDSVRSNRQSLLDQLSAMDVPNDRRATKLCDLLQQSLQHSIEADRYFAAWMHGVYNYYYAEPQGYLGNVPLDGNYHKAVSQSSMAGVSKSRFCRAYNPIALRFDLRHNWQAGQLCPRRDSRVRVVWAI